MANISFKFLSESKLKGSKTEFRNYVPLVPMIIFCCGDCQWKQEATSPFSRADQVPSRGFAKNWRTHLACGHRLIPPTLVQLLQSEMSPPWGTIVPKSLQLLCRRMSAHSLLPADFAYHSAERPSVSSFFTSAKYCKWRSKEQTR